MCAVKLGLLHNCSFCPHDLICRIGTRDGLETQAAGVEYAAATRLLLLHWQSSVQCNTGEFKWSRWWGSVTEPQAVFISDSSNHNLGGMLKKQKNPILFCLHYRIFYFILRVRKQVWATWTVHSNTPRGNKLCNDFGGAKLLQVPFFVQSIEKGP